jgi:hypothetical protein
MAAFFMDGISLDIQLHDVVCGDEFRRERAGHEKGVRVVRIANADVAIGIDDALVREYPIRNDQVIDQSLSFFHCGISALFTQMHGAQATLHHARRLTCDFVTARL